MLRILYIRSRETSLATNPSVYFVFCYIHKLLFLHQWGLTWRQSPAACYTIDKQQATRRAHASTRLHSKSFWQGPCDAVRRRRRKTRAKCSPRSRPSRRIWTSECQRSVRRRFSPARFAHTRSRSSDPGKHPILFTLIYRKLTREQSFFIECISMRNFYGFHFSVTQKIKKITGYIICLKCFQIHIIFFDIKKPMQLKKI